ncbi:MAG: glucose-1-phosphate thymidylyltransferase [Flavobacteriales bacterium TMED191]|nr:MAG: glucose-1-phosphate thymidylyltransferase [Flavobacteriales bacterium TMED191]
MQRKGIILAGGTGSRLYPITKAVSKQLLPIYDKPMIYYPLSTLMLAGIKEILLISNHCDVDKFSKLLGDGSHLGINIEYKIQFKPNGIAEAFLIGKEFIRDCNVALILGDNLFHGHDLINILQRNYSKTNGASIFVYPVRNPENYGVIEFDPKGKICGIEEKPLLPKSNFAITGLYFYDNTVINKAERIKPSKRGELEITDINKLYIDEGRIVVQKMNRGMTWLDTGTIDSLHEASSLVRSLEKRQGLKIGCPEEIAWRMGFINNEELSILSENLVRSGYGNYLKSLISETLK